MEELKLPGHVAEPTPSVFTNPTELNACRFCQRIIVRILYPPSPSGVLRSGWGEWRHAELGQEWDNGDG